MSDLPVRFREPDRVPWLDPVLVVCPACSRRATARRHTDPDRPLGSARLTCARCGFTQEWAADRLHVALDGRPVVLRSSARGWIHPTTGAAVHGFVAPEAVDARFGTPLWLRTPSCGHVLWANNEEHLAYLEAYVSATLRDRPAGGTALAWRLPGWMTGARHRDAVVRDLRRLRGLLGEP